MIFQPFREDSQAGVCAGCGGPIYSGDLSFSILGETLCADCVSESGYIAGEELLDDMDYLSDVYSSGFGDDFGAALSSGFGSGTGKALGEGIDLGDE